MARNRMMRLLCAILCLILLLADLPAGLDRAAADDIDALVIEDSDAPETASGDAPVEEPSGTPAEAPGDAPSADAPVGDAGAGAPAGDGGAEADAPRAGEPEPSPDEAPGAADEPQEGAELDALLEGWIAELDAQRLSGDYARALWLYDRLIANLEPGEAQDAQAALASRSAASAGYARACEALLSAAGIESQTIYGEAGAWNLALLDGSWVHIDAYMDDAPDCYGMHFGLNDAAMALDHRWEGEYPACDDLSNSYFVRERGYAAFRNLDELRALLASARLEGRRELFLLDACADISVSGALPGILAEIDPRLEADISESGCYATVRLREAEGEAEDGGDAAPDSSAPEIISSDPPAPEIISAEVDAGNLLGSVPAASGGAQGSAPGAIGALRTITFAKGSAQPSAAMAIGVGETTTASIAFAGGAPGTIAWSIPRECAAYASVNQTSGKITGKKASAKPVKIVATVAGQKFESEFYVINPVTKVEFEQRTSYMGANETFELGRRITGYTAVEGTPDAVQPSLDDGKVFSFTSDHPEIIRVDDGASGRITALKPGTATITLKSYNATAGDKARKASVRITVRRELGSDGTEFALSPLDPKLAKGDSMTVKADLGEGYANLQWTAEPADCVELKRTKNDQYQISVDSAAQTGDIVVTASAPGYADRSASATIHVIEAYTPDDFGISGPVKTKIGVGETLSLSAGASDEDHGGSVNWKSGSDRAKVAGGNVTGKKAGRVTITATAFNSTKEEPIQAAQKLTIIDAPTKLTCGGKTKSTVYLGVGETQLLSLKVGGYAGGETTGQFYKVSGEKFYSSTDEEVVAVDDSALPGGNQLALQGLAEGSSKITVRTYNGKSVVITVKVQPKPERIGLPEELLIAAGETRTLKATLLDAEERAAYAKLSWPKAGDLLLGDAQESSGFTIKAVDNATIKITAPKKIGAESLNQAIPLTVRAEGYAQSDSPIADAVCQIVLVEGPVGQNAKGKPKAGCNMELALGRTKLGAGEKASATFRFTTELREELSQISISSSNKSVAKVSAAPVEDKPGEYKITITASKTKTGKAIITARSKRNGEKVTKTISVAKAPKSISVTVGGTKNPTSLTMGVDESRTIKHSFPSGSAGAVTYSFDTEGVAEIQRDEKGNRSLVALATGETTLTVSAYNGKKRSIAIAVKEKPTDITFANPRVEPDGEDYRLVMGSGTSVYLKARTDEGSGGKLRYSLTRVSPSKSTFKGWPTLNKNNGKIKADKACTVRIKVSAYPEADIPPKIVTVEILKKPSSVSFRKANYAIEWGGSKDSTEPFDLWSQIRFPSGSMSNVSYSVAKDDDGARHISINSYGVVTALSPGKNEVTITTSNKKKAKCTIWVLTPEQMDEPQLVKLDPEAPSYLDVGGSYDPSGSIYVFPENLQNSLSWTWSASKSGVVDLDPSSGRIEQVGHGKVTITGVCSPYGKKLKYTISVSSPDCCMKMPAHRTKSKSAINGVLSDISDVKSAAIKVLNASSAGNKSARKSAINRAFEMYRFAWRPTAYIPYWRAANSEGGHKDFKTDTYYFGMPYTQNNRIHSDLNAYTTKASDGNYRKTTSAFNRRGRNYPGSDCSSFTSMAVWGYGSGHRGDVTGTIARANYYSTIDWKQLQPGDLICKGGSHVVMFLYFTNSAKSQCVVIEQGGGGTDLYSNCISTSLREISYYKNGGYIPRRPKGW